MRISDWSSDVCSSDLVGFRSEGILVAARRRLAAFVLLAACLRISWLFALVFVARHDINAGRSVIRIVLPPVPVGGRSEEHTSELQSLMRISYAVFCLKKK